jgi:hypothetical protein
MSTHPRAHLVALAVSASFGLFAASCKQSEPSNEQVAPRPTSAEVSEQATATATVRAIDPAARSITLQRTDGTTVVIVAGPQVANFDQIAVGDVLRVRYLESLAAEILEPEEADVPAGAEMAAGTAAPGTKPAAGIGVRAGVTVRVDSVDAERNIVVFTPPDGVMRSVRVTRPEGRELLKSLKPGDRVVITYSEALAISIDEQ